MSIKIRLQKLEDQRAAEVQPIPHKTPEEIRLLLGGIITKINASSGQPRKPWVICPVPDGMGVAGAHLHTMLNRIAEMELKEAAA